MLSLPGEAGSAGAALVAQTNALIDLAAGVQGSVTLRLAAFRQVYDALFDTRGSLLSGEVRVVVGSDTTSLPFIARMGDLAGDIFDTKVDVDATTLTVTLTNAIESPIRVAGLTGVIARNGKPIDGTSVTGLAPRPPVELAPAGGPTGQDATIPAGSLTVTLAGSAARAVISSLGGLFGGMLAHSGLGGVLGQDGASSESSALGDLANLVIDPSCVPLFDFSQVSVNPDPVATWRAIMANGTPGPISRPVNLKFLAATLTPPGAAPAHDAVLAIQVVFQTGQTASFDASQAPDAGGFMNQALKISVPMEAFVLGDGPTDGYTYRVDAITPGGVRKGDWVTDNRDTIYIVPG
jgi:hypothetical protein